MEISHDKTLRSALLCRWCPLFQHTERGIRTLSRDDDGAGESWRVDVHVQRVFTFL